MEKQCTDRDRTNNQKLECVCLKCKNTECKKHTCDDCQYGEDGFITSDIFNCPDRKE